MPWPGVQGPLRASLCGPLKQPAPAPRADSLGLCSCRRPLILRGSAPTAAPQNPCSLPGVSSPRPSWVRPSRCSHRGSQPSQHLVQPGPQEHLSSDRVSIWWPRLGSPGQRAGRSVPRLQRPTGPGVVGAAPGLGSQARRGVPLGWRPISGHLAATAAAPPRPVSGALISPRRGWARPDICPSAALPHPPGDAGCSLGTPRPALPTPLRIPLPPVHQRTRSQRPPPPGSFPGLLVQPVCSQGGDTWPRGPSPHPTPALGLSPAAQLLGAACVSPPCSQPLEWEGSGQVLGLPGASEGHRAQRPHTSLGSRPPGSPGRGSRRGESPGQATPPPRPAPRVLRPASRAPRPAPTLPSCRPRCCAGS